MPSDLLARLKELDESATKGPWFVVGHPWGDCTYAVEGSEDPHGRKTVVQAALCAGEDDEIDECDATCNLRVSVALRNALPALAAYVEAADAMRSTHGLVGVDAKVREDYDAARDAFAEQIGGGK